MIQHGSDFTTHRQHDQTTMLSRASPDITLERLRKTNSRSETPPNTRNNSDTYIINLDVYASSGVNLRPCSSRALRISSVESTEATAIHIASYAMNRPGQMHRPKPNATTSGSRTVVSISSSPVSFMRRNRSGSNVSESVYTSVSCKISLRSDRDQTTMSRWRRESTDQVFARTKD